MRHPLISIIVPVYNTREYLHKCLSSILNQTYKNLEILLVDDGSTDGSESICEEYSRLDSRVKVIHKQNSGYGASMNVGLEHATGKYIGIVEADDFISKNMFKKLISVAEKYNLDIAKSDFIEFSKANKKTKRRYVSSANYTFNYGKVFGKEDADQTFEFKMNIWTGIYKLDFLKENNIRFNETPEAAFQDNGFWFQTMALADRVMFLSKAFYHYRQDNPNSSINSKNKIFCMCDEYEFIANFVYKDNEHKRRLLKPYLKSKFRNYFYTYTRVAEEYKLTFLDRFSEEFKKHKANGELNNNLLTENEMNKLYAIMANPKQFYEDDQQGKFIAVQSKRNKSLEFLKRYGLKNTINQIFLKMKIKLMN